VIRGVRGAIQAEANTRECILQAAEQLMAAVIAANAIRADFVSAVFFTVTNDLNAAFPAEVRTAVGWERVPFLCSQEIPVPGSLPRVVRVLVLVETERSQEVIKHQYLGGAALLRPDLTE
jgi:chorismate mutase